jgi:hypothetical protein
VQETHSFRQELPGQLLFFGDPPDTRKIQMTTDKAFPRLETENGRE